MSSQAAGPPPGAPTPAEIYGPLLAGAFLSTFFFGITMVQFFGYYEVSKRDPLWMKAFMFYLFVADIVCSALTCGIAFQPLILEYGAPLNLAPIFLRSDGALTVAISMPVQMFMAWRIFILTRSKLAAIGIALVSLASFVGGIWTTVQTTLTPRFADIPHIRAPPTLWLLTSAITDVSITVALTYSLSTKKTGFRNMDSYLTQVIRLTIQTGAFTAIATAADAIVFLALPNTTIFFTWDFSISKLYLNSILSSLNARNTFREARNALFNSESLGSNGSRSRSYSQGQQKNEAYQLEMPRRAPQPGVNVRPDLESQPVHSYPPTLDTPVKTHYPNFD